VLAVTHSFILSLSFFLIYMTMVSAAAAALVELREEDDEEASSSSFVHLHDIDCDVAEWWCHYILGQPSGIDTFQLLEQVEQIIPRLLPLSQEHNQNLVLRMRALQVWQEFLADPLHVEVDPFSKVGERFEKATTQDYQHVLRLLQVLGQLLVLRLVYIQTDDPEQITKARNSYTDHLTKIYDKEVIPEPLLAVAIGKEEGSGHQAIANLVEDKKSPFGALQVQEALRKLLLKWCNELETPRFIQVGYRRVVLEEEEEEEDLPMTQELHSYNTRSRQSTGSKSHQQQQKQKQNDDDDDDSDETVEIKDQQSDETWIGGRDSEDVKLVWQSKSKKRGRGRSSLRIPPPVMQAFSSSDEDLHNRKRSKSMPPTSTNTTTTITTTNRKRGRAQLKTSRSRSVQAARAYKKKKPLPQQVTDAIRKGVSKYGYGNWTIIQKRSGGILKHLTGADIKGNANSLAEQGLLGRGGG
jgi:hypothetical protein